MKNIKILSILTLLIVSITIFPIYSTYAEDKVEETSSTFKPVCGDGTIDLPGCKTITPSTAPEHAANKLMPKLIPAFIGFGGAIAVIMLMVSGIRYLISLGNDDQVKKAQKMMFYALLGLGFALISYIIVQIVINLEF